MYPTRTAQDKWSQFGWRVEQRYGSKVLIGNWAEERLQVRIRFSVCLFSLLTACFPFTPVLDYDVLM